MFPLKVVVALLLCQNTSGSEHIFRPVENSGLLKVLSEITYDDDLLSIIWSQRVNNSVKDDILQVFKEKTKFIQNNYETLVEGRIIQAPDTILYIASTTADIVYGIPSIRDTNYWSVATKLIVVYLSSSEHIKTILSDPLVKGVFHTLDRNFQIICESGNGTTLLPHTIKGSYDTATVAILPQEPYSFHSKDAGFTKGLEVDLVKGLARWSHFNLELEAIGESELKGRNFDVIVGTSSHQVNDGKIQSIDFEFDDLTWCVKRAELHPPWRSFFLVGTWDCWLIGGISVYCIAATLYVFHRYYHHPENYHYCMGVTLLCCMSIPIPYNPTHGLARTHFGIMLVYGLLVFTLFNSFLITLLKTPPYQYQIHTVRELIEEEFKILVDEKLIAMQDLGDDEVATYVKQNYELCNGIAMCLRLLLEQPNVATIVSLKFAEYFEFQNNSPIFCFARSETFNRVTRSFKIDHSNRLLLNRTNSFIRRAMETGHLLKWGTVSTKRSNTPGDDNPVALTVEHILALLILYIALMSLSLLIFIGECLTFENIQKGDGAGRFWKFFHKYLLSVERIDSETFMSRRQVPRSRA